MSANVKCVGGLVPETRTDPDGEDVHIGSMTTVGPCGWTGKRKPHPAYGVPTTTLPCPRCGGTVELIGGAP